MMRGAIAGVALGIGLGVGMPTAGPTAAAVFVYVDPQGVSHFTDAPTHGGYRPLFPLGLSAAAAKAQLPPGRYADLIGTIAHTHALDPALIHAIIRAESDFDPRAISRKGARGLMQLMPETAGRMAVGNAFDPEANIDGGVRYLRWLLDLYRGNIDLALAAYNAGEKAVARYGGIPPFRETRQYVGRVLALYRRGRGPSGTTPAAVAAPAPAPAARVEVIAPAGSGERIYRTLDANGVVHYSNIPPLVRPAR